MSIENARDGVLVNIFCLFRGVVVAIGGFAWGTLARECLHGQTNFIDVHP